MELAPGLAPLTEPVPGVAAGFAFAAVKGSEVLGANKASSRFLASSPLVFCFLTSLLLQVHSLQHEDSWRLTLRTPGKTPLTSRLASVCVDSIVHRHSSTWNHCDCQLCAEKSSTCLRSVSFFVLITPSTAAAQQNQLDANFQWRCCVSNQMIQQPIGFPAVGLGAGTVSEAGWR